MPPAPYHGLGRLGLIVLVSSATICAPLAHASTQDTSSNNNLIKAQDGPVVLTATQDAPGILVLDYGVETEGIPSFDVVATAGDTSVLEITYSETVAALGRYMGDGPLPLAAAMDTYRINAYNISAPGQVRNRLIQGGFRYQKLNLSSVGEITLHNVGVVPTVHKTPLTELPGSFASSDSSLNEIWTAGARTLQLSEIPKNSVPEFWQVSSEGVLIDSQAPQAAVGLVAGSSTVYGLEFKVKPLVKGFGFLVLSDTLNSGIYISVDISAGTIAAYVGGTAQDTLLSKQVLSSDTIRGLDAWHQVNVEVAITEIKVVMDGIMVLELSQTSKFYGSYGLGASFGHRAVFKDLKATDAAGATTYEHSLTDKSCFDDFLVGTNPLDTSVDATRRDRIAYTGDLDIAGAAALASTHGLNFILGTLELFAPLQATPGFFVPTVKIQQGPSAPMDFNTTGLIGYSWNLLTAVALTYTHTGDIAFARTWAPKVQAMLDWSHSQVLPESGLFNLSEPSFGGDWNYYDPVQSGVVTKFNVVYAYALQETTRLLADSGIDASIYQDRLAALRTAIDAQLWSDELGAYVISESNRAGFAQDANALAILAGVNQDPAHSSDVILATLSDQLSTPRGPLAFSPTVTAAGFRRYISPYASGYHLRAALATGNVPAARELLDTLWSPMIDVKNANYTGCLWETLNDAGEPAFGHATSLAHGWAAGPTAELSRFVLGARATAPGWATWAVSPLTLGERWASGKVPTPGGGAVAVEWKFCDDGGLLSMTVQAPAGTKGVVTLPAPLLVSAEETVIWVEGVIFGGTSFDVEGGAAVHIVQLRK
ncbi:Six-hairpin glycosidase-like protein [Microdochium trichocladiopsis]|uniref:Six-hairpin glycosidase-like protein n=1 Tax=Microdochium trichocladiopsis TaxID=1682393 RepID=A0A9P9BHV3_9PEZI|nr:Six-hairpin glycosidase-like protein [Microdochium trichocladiopsis]KAH7009252.1 Six-hairpin glycosidase-like protein [Microdochium trichocladiopsis]